MLTSVLSGPPTTFPGTYGALLVGVAFAIFFQGALTVQTFIYYDSFPDDKKKIKATVALVYILDLVHLGLIFKSVYTALISHWGTVSALDATIPTLTILHVTFTAVVCTIVQVFFLRRIWVLSQRNIPLIVLLSIVVVVPIGLELFMGIECLANSAVGENWKANPQTGALFIMSAFTDLALALTMAFYLRRGKSGFAPTNNVISKCIQMVIGTGLATAMLAVGSSIAFYVRLDALYFMAIHFQLGKTYANALLASLNSRQQIRKYASNLNATYQPSSMQFALPTTSTDSEKGALKTCSFEHNLCDNGKRSNDVSSI